MSSYVSASYALAGSTLLMFTACFSEPPVDDGLSPPQSGVIAGDAVILTPIDAPHPVVLFLTNISVDEDGMPVYTTANLTVIPEDALSEGGAENGARTGAFAFPQVPPGTYVVSGIVDVDENFNPLVPELAGPSAGDVPGGYVDPTTGALIPITLTGTEIIGEITVIF